MKKISRILKQALKKSAQKLTEEKQLLVEQTTGYHPNWPNPLPSYYPNHATYWVLGNSVHPCGTKTMWANFAYTGYVGQGSPQAEFLAVTGVPDTNPGIGYGNIPTGPKEAAINACSQDPICRNNWNSFIFPWVHTAPGFSSACVTPGGEGWGGLGAYQVRKPDGSYAPVRTNAQDMISDITAFSSPGGTPYTATWGAVADNSNDFYTAAAIYIECKRQQLNPNVGIITDGPCCQGVSNCTAGFGIVGQGFGCHNCDNAGIESYNCDDCDNTAPYNANNGQCVDPGDGSGTYSIMNGHQNPLQECQNNCKPCIDATFDCIQGLCEENISGTGAYPSLNDCLTSQACDRWECQKPGTPCVQCNDTQYNLATQVWDPACAFTDQADCDKNCQPKPCVDFMAASIQNQQACCGKCVGNPPVYTGPAGDFCDTLHESCDCCPPDPCNDFDAWANALPGGTSDPSYSLYCSEACLQPGGYPVILNPTSFTLDPVNGVDYCSCCEPVIGGEERGCLNSQAINYMQCCPQNNYPGCVPTVQFDDCCEFDPLLSDIKCQCCEGGAPVGIPGVHPNPPGCSALNTPGGFYNCNELGSPITCETHDDPIPTIDTPMMQEGVQIKGKLLNSSRMAKLANIKKRKNDK